MDAWSDIAVHAFSRRQWFFAFLKYAFWTLYSASSDNPSASPRAVCWETQKLSVTTTPPQGPAGTPPLWSAQLPKLSYGAGM